MSKTAKKNLNKYPKRSKRSKKTKRSVKSKRSNYHGGAFTYNNEPAIKRARGARATHGWAGVGTAARLGKQGLAAVGFGDGKNLEYKQVRVGSPDDAFQLMVSANKLLKKETSANAAEQVDILRRLGAADPTPKRNKFMQAMKNKVTEELNTKVSGVYLDLDPPTPTNSS